MDADRSGFPFVLCGGCQGRTVISARWIQPSRALRSRVAAIAYVANTAEALRALPASGALLAIRFQGAVYDGCEVLPDVSLTGVQRSVRSFRYEGPVRSVLLRLTPQAVSSFGASAAELVDRTVGLAALGCDALLSLPDQLARARDAATVLTCLEDALSPLPIRRDAGVERAIALLGRPATGEGRAPQSGPSVRGVARELGLSERQLGRRFHAAVGLAPKQFASVRRLEHALRLLPWARTCAEVAHGAGYFDESHFARECARITGVSPGTLRRSQRTELHVGTSDLYKSANVP